MTWRVSAVHVVESVEGFRYGARSVGVVGSIGQIASMTITPSSLSIGSHNVKKGTVAAEANELVLVDQS